MSQVLQWLLGLERIAFDGESRLDLVFATPPARWIMLIGAILAAVAVGYLYRREVLALRWRLVLMLLRFGLIMTILLLFSRPMLVLRRRHVEPSTVTVLLDRSASMAEVDVEGPVGDPAPQREKALSRWQAAIRAFSHPERGLMPPMLARHRAEVWLFDESIERVGSLNSAQSLVAMTEQLESVTPRGAGTQIAGSLESVLERMHGNRLAGVILMSDGRETSPSMLEPVLSQAQARSAPIHVVSTGSPRARSDLAIVSVWAEEDVFVFDTVSVQVRLEVRGFESATPVRIELRDRRTDQVLERQEPVIGPGEPTWRGEFTYRPMTIGRKELRVAAIPRPDERIVQNNWADLTIQAHDEKISVLYVEDQPRFEYRYLKNLLLRESTIESSCLLLGATSGFAQEGTRPVRRFPRSVEELAQYDVVIFGDVDPRGDWLSPAQESMLVDFVSLHGGGLLFVAGERNMPHRLRRTKLEPLLPVRISPDFEGRYKDTLMDAFSAKLTADGREHPIFRLRPDRAENDALIESLPGWFWFTTVLGPQPAATVLLVHPSVRTADGPMPLAVLGRFGAGRTFYLGSDDLWRWRWYTGDSFYQNTWIQTLRTLARGHKLGPGRRWRLDTDRRRYKLGRPVRIEVTGYGDDETAAYFEMAVEVRDASDILVDRVILRRTDLLTNVLEGEFVPRQTGAFTLSMDLSTSETNGSADLRTISVAAPDPEGTLLEADHRFLKDLARRSGGVFLDVSDDLSQLAELLPDRSVSVPDDIEEPLWDSRLAMMLLVGLLLAEWIVRKSVGLA